VPSAFGWKTLSILAGAVLLAAPVFAQGNGHGNAFGHYNTTVSASTHDGSHGTLAGSGVRNFGSWLDDATVQDPGGGFVSIGVGVFRTPVYREVDLPSIDSGFGVTRRLQVGMSVPFYHGGVPGDPVTRGFGDVYLTAKYQLRPPSEHRAGFAVIPMVEVLSVPPPSGGSRVQWALPASVERQFTHWRTMASGGWFSRGAVFGAGAVELELGKRAWATGALSHSYSTRQDDLSTALGFHRSRTDLSGGVTYALRPAVAVYGSAGRTISARDDNSATFIFSAGVSFGLTRPARR
jgi:hypothetical protein